MTATPLPIEQRHRDAAADYLAERPKAWLGDYVGDVRKGLHDDNLIVQLLAQFEHHLSAAGEGVRAAALEEAARVAETYTKERHAWSTPTSYACEGVARAIRKLIDAPALIPSSKEAAEGSLLREPTAKAPSGCHCPPDQCGAPVIMGRQQPCRREALAPKHPKPSSSDIPGKTHDALNSAMLRSSEIVELLDQPSSGDVIGADREALAAEYRAIGDDLNAGRILHGAYVCEEVDIALRAIAATRLAQPTEALREALEPFAAMGRVMETRARVTFGKVPKDSEIVCESSGEAGMGILTMGHFRDAAYLLPDAPGWGGMYRSKIRPDAALSAPLPKGGEA